MIYCISDIHGDLGLLKKMLRKINFSQSDRLIVCGDIINKGHESVKLAQYLFSMPNVDCIAGNHEYRFLKYYTELLDEYLSDNELVLKKLQEYFPYDGHLLDWKTVETFKNLPFYIEEENFICVHAGVPMDSENHILPLQNASLEQLAFDTKFREPDVEPANEKCVIFGHTPSKLICGESRVLMYKRKNALGDKISDYYKINLDTGTWLEGVLGCFCIDTCKVYYVKK